MTANGDGSRVCSRLCASDFARWTEMPGKMFVMVQGRQEGFTVGGRALLGTVGKMVLSKSPVCFAPGLSFLFCHGVENQNRKARV